MVSVRITVSRRLLPKVQLLEVMASISNPRECALTQRGLEQVIENFCAGCPDPIQAYSLIAENPDSMTDGEVVARALSMPYLPISSVPASIVSSGHPVRSIAD